ncbi:hypothetical protein IFR05_013342 [Cadophora sp. M221]|nr:hypothetical protein IFR05_013342 [Cadophora sp. M221]
MEYSPLNPDLNEIRLLTLLPDDDGNSSVGCILDHVSLINPPEFAALSYFWGDQAITKPIAINGITVPVTANLESALQHLRAKGYSRLWFFERPYWRRVWVIQELALARRIVVHCGESNADWSRISKLVALYGEIRRQKLGPEFSTCGIGYMEKLLSFHEHASNFRPLSFLEALLRSSGSLSTDSRDKVFALLGLVHDSRLYIPVPNYRQSVEDICLSMTLSAIATTSRLEIIPLLGSGCDSKTRLASWIPNWIGVEQLSKRHIGQLIEYLRTPQNEENSKSRLNSKHSLLSTTPVDSGWSLPKVATGGTTLSIKALLIDAVDGLTLTISEAGDDPCLEHLRSQSSYSNNPYPSNIYPVSNFLRTLLQDATLPNNFALLGEPLSFLFTKSLLLAKKLREHEQNWLLASRNLVVNGSSLLETTLRYEQSYGRSFRGYRDGYSSHSSLLGTSSCQAEDDMFQALQSQLSKNMRFMTTRRGYMGWVHTRACQGDVIAVFENCEVLVALRPRSEGGYLIVGDAYIEDVPNFGQPASFQSWTEIEIY